MVKTITRRKLLAGLVAGVSLLSLSCGGATTTASPAAPATGAKPTAPAGASAAQATAAPAAKPTTAAASTAPTPGAAAAKSGTLTVIHRIAYGPEIDKQVFPVGYNMFREKYGVTVEETLVPEDQQMPVKILTMVAGGTPPDAAYIHPQWLASIAAKGAILPIDSLMNKDANTKDLSEGALQYFQFPHGAK